MTTKYSQFTAGGLARTTDITVGLRGGINVQFTNAGLADSLGSTLVTYTQVIAPGSAVNYIDISNEISGAAPAVTAKGSDVNVNLRLQGQGVTGYVEIVSTGAMILPIGTTGEQPSGAAGEFRYNSTTGLIEWYDAVAGAWKSASSGGSTVTSVSGTLNRITSTGGLTPVIDISASYAGQASITTLGTIGAGVWNGTVIDAVYGGTGLAVYALGDMIYSPSANTLSRLTGNITTTQKFLAQTGDGANSAAPSWEEVSIPSASTVTTVITQANAFAGGEWVYLNSGTYTVGSNASAITAEIVGVVAYSPAPTGANFTLQTNGYLTGGSGFTAGTVYFVGAGGALTATPPTTIGEVVKPLFVADSTTSGVMINFRGELIAAASLQAYDAAFMAGFSAAGVAENVAVQSYGFLAMGRAGTFTGETGYADTAPTGAALIIDVFKNGVTIYSTKPQFAATSQTLTAGVLSVTTFGVGDRITFKITQVGSTLTGQGVRFTLLSTTDLI